MATKCLLGFHVLWTLSEFCIGWWKYDNEWTDANKSCHCLDSSRGKSKSEWAVVCATDYDHTVAFLSNEFSMMVKLSCKLVCNSRSGKLFVALSKNDQIFQWPKLPCMSFFLLHIDIIRSVTVERWETAHLFQLISRPLRKGVISAGCSHTRHFLKFYKIRPFVNCISNAMVDSLFLSPSLVVQQTRTDIPRGYYEKLFKAGPSIHVRHSIRWDFSEMRLVWKIKCRHFIQFFKIFVCCS